MMRFFIIGCVAGLVYYIFIRLTGTGLPCLFHLVTGWQCPGCGITRMLYQTLQLHFSEAFGANPFLFVTSPLLLLQGIYVAYKYYKGERLSRRNEIMLYIYCAAFCCFGILRNLLH